MFDGLENLDTPKTVFDNMEDKEALFNNIEDSKNGLFSGLNIGKSASGVMNGIAAKFKGKNKEGKKEEFSNRG